MNNSLSAVKARASASTGSIQVTSRSSTSEYGLHFSVSVDGVNAKQSKKPKADVYAITFVFQFVIKNEEKLLEVSTSIRGAFYKPNARMQDKDDIQVVRRPEIVIYF